MRLAQFVPAENNAFRRGRRDERGVAEATAQRDMVVLQPAS